MAGELVRDGLSGRVAGRIGDAGVARLAALPELEELESLSLEDAGCGPAGARALAASPHLGRLHTLDLERNDIGDEGAIALAGSSGLSKLRVLKLGHDGFGVRGLSARNSIGCAGATALVSSPTLSALERLDLPTYEIDRALASALASSPLLWIHPGALDARRVSPDGAHVAFLEDVGEVWGDGPCVGTLVLGDAKIAHVSPSFVWSHDSSALAICVWERANDRYSGRGSIVVVARSGRISAELPPRDGAFALVDFDGKSILAFDALREERVNVTFNVPAEKLAAKINAREGFRFHTAFVWGSMPIRPADWVYRVRSAHCDGADLVLVVRDDDDSPEWEIRVSDPTGGLHKDELRIETATRVTFGDSKWSRVEGELDYIGKANKDRRPFPSGDALRLILEV